MAMFTLQVNINQNHEQFIRWQTITNIKSIKGYILGELLTPTNGVTMKAIWHYKAHLALNIKVFKVEQRYEFTAIFGKNLTLSKCQTPEIDIWCFTQLAMTFKHPLSSNNLQSLDFTITEC